jgi:predicted MFS family arabinose efflux permease
VNDTAAPPDADYVKSPDPPKFLEPVLERFTRLGWARNFTFGVLNGWFVSLGDGFMNAGLVLSSFAAALNAPNLVIALLPAITVGGWLLPQIVVAAQIQHIRQKVIVYRAASVVRAGAFAVIVLSCVVFSQQTTWLLVAFLIGLIVNSVASGASGLPWTETVAKTVPPQQRAAFFGTRNLYGGLLTLVAGITVRALLGSSLPFPWEYTIIFALGGLFYTTGYQMQGFIEEPQDPVTPKGNILAEFRAILPTLRADADFRHFVTYRILYAASTIGDAFFTAHALRDVRVDQASIGTFLIVVGVIAPLSNAVWTRVALKFGSRRILRVALGIALLAPITAALMPRGAGVWYALVFVFQQVAVAGFNLGNSNYILGILPSGSRGRYIGIANTLIGVAVFTPVLGGFLADAQGYNAVFIVGAVLYALTWLRAGTLRRDL